MALSATDYQALQNASQQTGVPLSLLSAVAQQETGGTNNPDIAVSSTGAVGLMQILPSTAASPGYGITPLASSLLTDPNTNATFAAQYLQALYNKTGSWAGAISAYSGGSYTLATLQANNPGLLSGSDSTTTTSTTGGNVSGSAPSSTFFGSFFGSVWEIVSRSIIIMFGITLILVALIALLEQSKTVRAATETLLL